MGTLMTGAGGAALIGGTAMMSTGYGIIPGIFVDASAATVTATGIGVATAGGTILLMAKSNKSSNVKKAQEISKRDIDDVDLGKQQNSLNEQLNSGFSNNDLLNSSEIDTGTLKELKKYGLDKKASQALKNGYAKSRFGSNGIIKLTKDEIKIKNGKTYIYKLKIAKAGYHLRINGYINDEGKLIFDYITKG